MAIVSIPKNMSKACKLYLERNFEEADRLMDKISEPYRQKLAVEAQLALFRWDFDNTITKCMEFLPYLNEWYSLNMLDASFAMITFSAAHTRRAEVIGYLENLKPASETEDNERFKNFFTARISSSIGYLTGKSEKKNPDPQPECLLSLDEAIEKWKTLYKAKRFDGNSPESVNNILYMGDGKIKPNEYVGLYERFRDSTALGEHTRVHAIKTYLKMNKTEMIPGAVYDLYKYSWLPVEKTTVMPISILTYDTDLWEFYTEELFEKIYKTANVFFGGAV